MKQLTDLHIANEAPMQPIISIAKAAGIPEQAIELYGNYKAKINPLHIKQAKSLAKVVLVTAMSPTSA